MNCPRETHGGPARPVARNRRIFTSALFALLAAAPFATSVDAQLVRNFTIRYETRTNGDIVQIGNTVMTCPDADPDCANARNAVGGSTSNNDFSMVRVDIDADGTTETSSSADIALGAGQTVLFAGLYFGARSSDADRYEVKLSTPVSAGYVDLTATQQDIDPTGVRYNGFVDVTSLVQAGGNGTYTVADIKADVGTDHHGGWAIIMVVQDAAEPLRSLQVYDGYARVSSSNPVTMTASGLIVPPAGPVTTLMGTVVYEGDVGFTGDNYQLNGTAIGDAPNPTTNYHNSSITFRGSHLTAKNPNYQNQLGFDATWVDVSSFAAIPNGSTTATIDLETTGDVYFPAVATFATDLFSPSIEPTYAKTVTDVNGGTVLPGDTLQYDMTFSNTGDDAAINVILVDTIPDFATYAAGSLEVTSGANAGTKTDLPIDDQAEFDATVLPDGRVVFRLGTTADGVSGGRIGPAESTAVRFRVVVDAGTPDGTDITNRGHVAFDGETSGLTGLSATSTDAVATVEYQADLDVVLTGPDSVMIADTALFEIVTTNLGPSPAASAVVTFSIPAGFTFASANRSASEGGGTVTWPAIGTLAAAAVVTDTVRLTATVLGTQLSSAAASTSTDDPVAGNSDGSAAQSQQSTLIFRDTDGDGIADASDLDDDNDGIPDTAEGSDAVDTDGDSWPDSRDLDSDGDGIADVVEAGGTDANNDGVIDGFTDANDDGLDDTTAGAPLPDPNTDGTGAPDRQDIDADGDGITDNVEAQAEGSFRAPQGADTDNDGWDDEYDSDDGGTAITLANTDSGTGDTTPDYQDTDSDADNVDDVLEGHDADSNGVADRSPSGSDTDGDGLDDAFDPDDGGTSAPLQDTDTDSTRDWRDTDDDGDGVDTVDEDDNANSDPTDDDDDGDGTPDYLDDDDTDGDGVPDSDDVDDDNDGILDTDEGDGATNTDGDAFPDSRDIDADGDGITDNVEAQAEGSYRAPQGVDTDDDGLDDEYDTDDGGTPITIANTDSGTGDTTPDFQDSDSDADNVDDVLEGHDADSNGVADRSPSGTDTDGDGLDNAFDPDDGGTSAPLQDTDTDSTRDWRDTDDDGDGVDTVDEDPNANSDPTDDDDDGDGTPDYLDDDDTDGDGVPDSSDLDDDNDGILDTDEGDGATNTDGDAFPDSRDIDADGDGITDNVEAQAEGSFRAPQGVDTDGDGLDDEYDTDNGGTPITIANTDSGTGDTTPDFQDTDSDADNVDDLLEGHDADSNGVADRSPSGSDTDGDGLDDAFDPDDGGTSAPLQDTDTDSTRDWRDTDDDGDGVDTVDEDPNANSDPTDDDDDGDGTPDYLDDDDFDGDGVPDASDLDDDNDGLPDSAEGSAAVDTDGDGQPDSRDLDSDGDGIADVVEAGGTDANGDGEIDGFTDGNSDGLDDTVAGAPLPDPNTDGTGGADRRDIDSDGDGITDNIEAQAEGSFTAPSGSDTDGDGWDDAYDADDGGTAITLANTDAGTGDTTPDYLDTDSDADNVDDVLEGHDADSNGVADRSPSGSDTDGDGLDDAFDPDDGGTSAPLQDTDTDSTRDWRDTDDDGDGVDTSAEDGNSNSDPTDDDDDGDGTPDYLDSDDTDGDGVPDNIDTDDDGDGIPDATEGDGATNTDGDANPDSRDIDADNDGIPDNIEAQAEGAFTPPTGVDTDGDGLDDAYDPDNGGTPITLANTDSGTGDTTPDYLDSDSDGDNVDDVLEGHDANSNGVADRSPSGTDTDGDGLDDAFDPDNGGTSAPLQDTDTDSTRDWRDTDDDGDGVDTSAEDGNANSDPTDDDDDGDGIPDYLDNDDTDGDGVPDNVDSDDDGDGIPDASEGDGATDTDGDGLPDSRDIDADGDGIIDNVEAQAEGSFTPPTGVDTDGDGIDDAYDADDGGTPIVLANTDSGTGDTTPDFQDTDSDGDNVDDVVEGHDADSDGTADRVPSGTDTDGDGLDDAFDTDNGGTTAPLQDTDSDSTRDWRDTDDDGDGVDTIDEDANSNGDPTDDDADGDGTADYLDSDDTDGDGVPDSVDQDDDGDGIPDSLEGDGATDTDGDGIPDSLDIDADGDGITDNVEAQAEGSFTPPTGVDTDGDGMDDAYDVDDGGTPIVPVNSDLATGDTTPDFQDTDSDGDNVDDVLEGHDADSNGTADRTPSGSDTDGDGLDDAFDPDNGGTSAPLQDTDSDATRDWRDADDDGDGVDTRDEDVNTNGDPTDDDADGDGMPDYLDSDDTDRDGVPDSLDQDDDGDGIPDSLEGDGATDTDGDGIPDSLDIDADGDGIIDNVEAQAEGAFTPPSGTDTDGDGLDDAYDLDDGGTPIVPVNTDAATGDTAPDFQDTDSDGDGVDDLLEGHDADSNGTADRDPAGADTDGDGLDDAFDPDNGGTSAPLQDTDSDSTRDWRDTDDDGDGVDTADEDTNTNGDPTDDDADSDGMPDYLDADDTDGDGVPNSLDADDDGDGLPDVLEGDGAIDSDGDGIPNSLDIDSDGDGITDNVEAQTDSGFTPPSGMDTDGDGIDDAYDADNGGTPIVPTNTDAGTGDTTPDYLDTDSDGDGVDDATEGHDANADGSPDVTPSGSDADGDGLDDAFDPDSGGTSAPLPDTDSDGARDWRDTDDDGDGVDTADEDADSNGDPTNDDSDGDGRPDYLDPDDTDGDGVPDSIDEDDDGDGLPDVLEGDGATDTDGDGVPDSLDIDADGDGIPDNIEAQAEDAFVPPTGNDADGDGLDDAYDPDNGGTPIVPTNTDAGTGDTTPDYLDTDSDGDGVDDATEGHDADADGVPDVTPTGTDTDGDGLDDAYDTDDGGTAAPLPDTDADATRDWRDTDDDDDGIDTTDEDIDGDGDPTNDDSDGDGTPDYLDLPAVDLTVRKEGVGDFVAGQQASFRIVVSNIGPGSSTGAITVLDTLPAGLTYASVGGAGWSATAAGQAVTATHPGPVASGDSLVLTLDVQVADDLTGTITNTAFAETPGDPSSDNNNSGTSAPITIASVSEMVLDKQATRVEAEIGDLVGYVIRVENIGTGTLTQVEVTDQLPAGFSYMDGSATLDGAVSDDPTGAPGPTLVFTIPLLAPGQIAQISYSVRVGVGAQLGDGINTAIARSITTGSVSTEGAARVRIRAGVFSDEAYIAGVVYTGRDTDPEFERGDVGVPGVRVYLQDGTSAVTDLEGRYSFYGLRPRLYIVRVDESTLPPGAQLAPISTRHSDDGGILFADLTKGEYNRSDFAEASGRDEVRAAIEDRRVRPSGPTQMFDGGQSITPDDPLGIDAFDGEETILPGRGSASAAFGQRYGAADGGVAVGVPAQFQEADGRTAVPVEIRLETETGAAAIEAETVTLETTHGEWISEDADPLRAGHQARVVNGRAEATLQAPMMPAQATVRATANTERMGAVALRVGENHIDFVPRGRDVLLTGLIEGRVDWRSLTNGELLAGTRRDGFDDAIESLAFDQDEGQWTGGIRGAAFATGEVGDGTHLTLRIDTEENPTNRLFNDIRPEELYTAYGDASSRLFEAQSKGRFFGLVERQGGFLQYGDFTTAALGGARTTLGRYARTLNGGLGHVGADWGSLEAFYSRDRFQQVIDEIPGRGVSGPYELSRADGLLNSERIEIVTRDRSQPSVILSIEPQQRFTDYTVEPFTGRIVFRRPIPSLDPDLNPISIRVSYELEQGGDAFNTYGVAARLSPTSAVDVVGTWIQDDNPMGSYRISSANAGLALGQGTRLEAEVAMSDSADTRTGTAFRIGLQHASSRFEAGAFMQDADRSFFNPSAGIGAGRREIRANARASLDDRTRFLVEGLRTQSRLTQGYVQGAMFGVERSITDRFIGELGYRWAEQSGVAALATPATDPVDVGAVRAKLTGLVGPRASIFGEFEQDIDDSARKRLEVGGDLLLFDRARAYGRHELISSFAGPYALNGDDRVNQTVFGLSADYLGGSTAYTEYRARNAFDGRQAQAAVGLRNQWQVKPGLGLGAAVERVSGVSGTTSVPETFAIAGSVEYTGSPLWRGTARTEYRSAGSTDQLFGSLGLARKLSNDWTFLGQSVFSHVYDGPRYMRTRAGLAYRSLETNRWNMLARYELKREQDIVLPGTPETTGPRSRTAHILSTHTNLRPNQSMVLALQAASKFSNEELGAITLDESAHLLSGRLTYDLSRNWDVGFAARSLFSGDFDEQQFGLGFEVGRRMMNHIRMMVGYNAFGFRDDDLTADLPTDHGVYFGVDIALFENMFGFDPVQPKQLVAPPPPPEPIRDTDGDRVMDDQDRCPATPAGVRVDADGCPIDTDRDGVYDAIDECPATPAGVAVDDEGCPIDTDGDRVPDFEDACPNTPAGVGVDARGCRLDGDEDGVFDEVDQCPNTPAGLEVDANGCRILFEEEDTPLVLEGVNFGTSSDELLPEAMELLDGVADALIANPDVRVRITGHTDGTGDRAFNLDLSQRRAETVRRYLTERGVAPGRLEAQGIGPDQPIAPNNTAEGRALNRRVELERIDGGAGGA